MYESDVKVPKPIYKNRHVIVMQYIKGKQLSDIISLDEPEIFLVDILENMQKAYDAGIIHSDLSEYNILIDEETVVWIIDWPQYITSDHLNAEEILTRDIGNITYYFKRKHGTSMTREQAIMYVKN
jgi:RIO kinase 2